MHQGLQSLDPALTLNIDLLTYLLSTAHNGNTMQVVGLIYLPGCDLSSLGNEAGSPLKPSYLQNKANAEQSPVL